MKVLFLIDENERSRERLDRALRRLDPSIDVIRVGDAGAPALGTLDPDILLYCEQTKRALITRNRRSMPQHVADHFAAGHHHYGIFQLRSKLNVGDATRELYELWEASEAEEWIDVYEWIPLGS